MSKLGLNLLEAISELITPGVLLFVFYRHAEAGRWGIAATSALALATYLLLNILLAVRKLPRDPNR